MNVVILAYHPSMLTNWVVKLSTYMKWCKLIVLHIASLHNVKPIQIQGVDLYDISRYNYKSINALITKIKPNLFIFLSFRSILELTFQRICEKHHIPKVYLEHGLFSKDTLKFRSNKLKKEFGRTFKRQFSFAKTHLGFMISSGQFMKEMKIFWQVYLRKSFRLVPYDHYFVFSRRSFDNYSKIFPLELNKNVSYIGYPIFNDEGQKQKIAISNSNGILYVHQPFISDGLAKISYSQEKQWLIQIAQMLMPQYGAMTILLHPRAVLVDYKNRFKDSGIDIIKAPNDFSLFANKSLIVGHYSTALLYGLYFERPTVVLDYPTMKNDPFFSELFTYVDDIKKILTIKIHVNASKKTYMVGDYNTFEHISNVLFDYASSH